MEVKGGVTKRRHIKSFMLTLKENTSCCVLVWRPWASKGLTFTWKTHFFVDAQSLDVSTRLTNIQFTVDLWNTSSQAYKNLTASIIEEVVSCGLWKEHLYGGLIPLFPPLHQSCKCSPWSPTDTPVFVSGDEGHGGCRPRESWGQEPISRQCRGQLHHHRHSKWKPGHFKHVDSSAALPNEQLQIHSGWKQHKHKWFVSFYSLTIRDSSRQTAPSCCKIYFNCREKKQS